MRPRFPFICLNCSTPGQGYRKTSKYCNARCQMNYEYRVGIRNGMTITEAAHRRIRERGWPERRGLPIKWLRTPEVNKKVSETKTGKPVPKLQGANHWNWKGGVSKSYWKTPDYQAWRRAVMRRDNYTCVQCGDNKGGNLEADHIKPRFLFPELMLELTNGRTLCKSCHRKTDTWGRQVTHLTRKDFSDL